MTALVIAWVWLVIALCAAGLIAAAKGWDRAEGVLIYAVLLTACGPVLVLLILATIDVLTGSEIVL